MLGTHGVMMADSAAVLQEGIFGGFFDVKILVQLTALDLATAEGEVETRAGVIVMADVAADPRIHAGVANGFFNVGDGFGSTFKVCEDLLLTNATDVIDEFN